LIRIAPDLPANCDKRLFRHRTITTHSVRLSPHIDSAAFTALPSPFDAADDATMMPGALPDINRLRTVKIQAAIVTTAELFPAARFCWFLVLTLLMGCLRPSDE